MKKAYYRLIPVYFDPITEEIRGRNWLYDQFLAFAIWFDIHIVEVEYFPIHIEIE